MKIVLFANTDWYLFNFRQGLAFALKARGHEVVLLSPPGEYGQKLVDSGFRWEPLEMDRRSLGLLAELMVLIRLFQWLRREGPDLVHAFTIKCAIYSSICCLFAGVKMRVNAIAGMGYVFTSSDIRARLLRPIVSGLLRVAMTGRCARLIVQNSSDAAFAIDSGICDRDSLRIIFGSGVDTNEFAPSGRTVGSERRLRVLLAARLLRDKGVFEFAEAARLLKATHSEIEFILAGRPDIGNPAAIPIETIESWVAADTVEWLGHVEDMSALLKCIDVFVLPSYREGLPKGLIEAGACGCGLITTDAPGCNEVVRDGLDGLIVPVGNAQKLAQAIVRFERDRGLLGRLGEHARESVIQRFDLRIVVEQTLSVYDELMYGNEPLHATLYQEA